MNYIARLKLQKEFVLAWVREFRQHLASEKFQGTEPDGSRKDWIAVKDVQMRLDDLMDLLNRYEG